VPALVVRQVADVLPDNEPERIAGWRLWRRAVEALEATDQPLEAGDDGSR
jgi:hypothetical protein